MVFWRVVSWIWNGQTATIALINRLPADVLHQIFTLALPTSYPSPVDARSMSKFFSSSAPYNISGVCHSWRDLVLSSPSLWSSLFHSLTNPSDETLKLLLRLIEHHLRRSLNLPLTVFVRLEGKFNRTLSEAIATLLFKHQRRWRRVGIWFETEIYNNTDCFAKFIPIPKTQLFTEDLALLEDLHVTFCTEYIITSSADRSLRNSLPSLTRLDLHTVRDSREAMRWLDLAPNVRS